MTIDELRARLATYPATTEVVLWAGTDDPWEVGMGTPVEIWTDGDGRVVIANESRAEARRRPDCGDV